MDDFIGSEHLVVDEISIPDPFATWVIEGSDDFTAQTSTEFQIPYGPRRWQAAELAYMDFEEGDPHFWVYLAILLTVTLLTFFLSIISCSVIADIRRQKDDATCCLDEMEDNQDKNCEDENVTNYMATVGHRDPKKLEAQYQDVVQKYLKQQKKMHP